MKQSTQQALTLAVTAAIVVGLAAAILAARPQRPARGKTGGVLVSYCGNCEQPDHLLAACPSNPRDDERSDTAVQLYLKLRLRPPAADPERIAAETGPGSASLYLDRRLLLASEQ